MVRTLSTPRMLDTVYRICQNVKRYRQGGGRVDKSKFSYIIISTKNGLKMYICTKSCFPVTPDYAVKYCLKAKPDGAEPQKDGICDHLAVYDHKNNAIKWKNDKKRERETPWTPPQCLIEHDPITAGTCRDYGCLMR